MRLGTERERNKGVAATLVCDLSRLVHLEINGTMNSVMRGMEEKLGQHVSLFSLPRG
jgi:hypothetical protein